MYSQHPQVPKKHKKRNNGTLDVGQTLIGQFGSVLEFCERLLLVSLQDLMVVLQSLVVLLQLLQRLLPSLVVLLQLLQHLLQRLQRSLQLLQRFLQRLLGLLEGRKFFGYKLVFLLEHAGGHWYSGGNRLECRTESSQVWELVASHGFWW